MLDTPVVFIIFNRPELTAVVFEAIRAARPAHLLVVADGPRPERPGESARCAEARAIVDRVDWPCAVQCNFSSVNLGCKQRIVSGLTWAFDLFEDAIVLEDDVVPDASFFPYCQELLQRYRNDSRVGVINGGRFLSRALQQEQSYYFSRFGHVWGWASWRRVWEKYDPDLLRWPEQGSGWLNGHMGNKKVASYWTKMFNRVHRQEIDTWDYQLDFCLWSCSMCAIAPSVNMVSNLGFGEGATHTTGPSQWSGMTAKAMTFPLVHPEHVAVCKAADAIEYENYLSTGWLQRKRRSFQKVLSAWKAQRRV